MPTRQQCFVLLKQTDEALNGGLEGEANAICTAAASAVRSVDSATSSSLAMAALSFLATFFAHHSGRIYASHLTDLVPAIIRCMRDKLQRVNFEAFTAASALAQSLRPHASASPLAVNYSKPVQQLFDATTSVLGDTSVDGEVRERALDTLGNLLVHEGDALVKSYASCFPLISARLATESTTLTAVHVIGRIAESPLCKGPDFNAWLLQILPEVVVALRKTRRTSSKNAELACLQSVLTRVGETLPSDTAEALVSELKQFIDAPLALSTISLIISLQPSSRTLVEQQILPEVMDLIKTPSLHPAAVDALASFFDAYVNGQKSIASKLVTKLTENLDAKAQGALPDATQGGTSVYGATARCVGVVVGQGGDVTNVLSPFEKALKVNQSMQRTRFYANDQDKETKEAEMYLSLLCVGEIGRLV